MTYIPLNVEEVLKIVFFNKDKIEAEVLALFDDYLDDQDDIQLYSIGQNELSEIIHKIFSEVVPIKVKDVLDRCEINVVRNLKSNDKY